MTFLFLQVRLCLSPASFSRINVCIKWHKISMFGLGLVCSCVLACSMICFQKEVSVLYDYTQNIHKNLEFHIHPSSCVNKSLFLLTTAGLVCVSSCLFGFFVLKPHLPFPINPPPQLLPVLLMYLELVGAGLFQQWLCWTLETTHL